MGLRTFATLAGISQCEAHRQVFLIFFEKNVKHGQVFFKKKIAAIVYSKN